MRFRLPTRPSARTTRGVLADGWYSWLVEAELEGQGTSPSTWTALTTALKRFPEPLAAPILASGPLRGLALGLLSTRYGAVAMNRHDRGWRTLLLTRALLGRQRKLVVFQFFDHPPAPAVAARIWARIERACLRRTLAVAQVLTQAELDTYPHALNIPADRFQLIRFPARSLRRGVPVPASRDSGPVLAAGRAHCDWRTLFAAASERGWDLRVVCGAEDRRLVDHLNQVTRAGAQVQTDLPAGEARALLEDAAISVICVTDGLVGRGHIRLLEAVDTATAVVASDVRSLHGYAEDGVTAVLVRPGDPGALRAAVERLLGDASARRSLAEAAFDKAAGWTGPDYLARLQALAAEVPDSG